MTFWLENFKEYFGENTLLDQNPYAKVKEYRQHLKKKLTPRFTFRKESSINKEMSCLRQLFKGAVERDIIESSPFANMKTLCLKENNKKTRYLTQEEIDRLLATTMPEWCRNILIGILHTGMRRQEILGLQWHQIRDGFIYLHKTKTQKARQIPLDDYLDGFLKELKLRYGLRSPYIFSNVRGQKIIGNTFSFARDSVMRRANISDCTAHTLRHTFASHFMMRGGDLPGLQKILGHENINMTMRYAHLAPGHMKKAMAKMNDITGGFCDENVTSTCHKASMESIGSNG